MIMLCTAYHATLKSSILASKVPRLSADPELPLNYKVDTLSVRLNIHDGTLQPSEENMDTHDY